jgi:hypothetical protein
VRTPEESKEVGVYLFNPWINRAVTFAEGYD